MTFFARTRTAAFVPVSLLVLAFAAAPRAQQTAATAPPAPPAAPLPAARAIIDKYIDATGGKDVQLKQQWRRVVGKISMPAQGLEGDIVILAARPDLTRMTMTLPGIGEIQQGYDGKVAWSVNPLTGPMLLQGKALQQTIADAEFDSSLHTDKSYRSLETVETTQFEGRPAYKVKATRTNGDEDLEFYDVDTGLLVGAILTRESPMGPVTATHVTSDYKTFGGMKVATKITQKVMGTEQVITISAVDFDPIDKAQFTPPASIQALIK